MHTDDVVEACLCPLVCPVVVCTHLPAGIREWDRTLPLLPIRHTPSFCLFTCLAHMDATWPGEAALCPGILALGWLIRLHGWLWHARHPQLPTTLCDTPPLSALAPSAPSAACLPPPGSSLSHVTFLLTVRRERLCVREREEEEAEKRREA